MRNAVAIGLPVLICTGVHETFADGDEVAIDLAEGTIASVDGKTSLQGESLPPEMREILAAGGILALLDSQTAG
jgi:3-isopropylmalate dehydratase small subunit